jgi:hypothetical protein
LLKILILSFLSILSPLLLTLSKIPLYIRTIFYLKKKTGANLRYNNLRHRRILCLCN